MKKHLYLFITMTESLFFLNGCSSGGGEETPVVPTPNPPAVVEKIPVSLNCGVSSRVTDNTYEEGDKVGLFIVNYNGNSAGNLNLIGNHADNVPFTLNDNKWTTPNAIYWKDETTPADFYCYYPYASITSLTEHDFSVKTDQSTETAYKASEFLYGTLKKVSPSSNAVNITTYHLMSCMVIKLEAGDGFSEERLLDAVVKINGIKTEADIDLSTGSMKSTGDAKTVLPLFEDGQYRALVVPQTVSVDNLISVEIDGREYVLAKDFTFESGKRHTFTVVVNKTSNGINVNIGAWEDDGVDNGGTAV